MNGCVSSSATWRAALMPLAMQWSPTLLTGFVLAALVAGCGGNLPEGALVLTQTPATAAVAGPAADLLDERYPAGSRVVILLPPFDGGSARILSKSLVAAGGPVVSPCGKRIFFVGKNQAGGAWQIYETSPDGRRFKAITTMDGGAMDPAILSNGDLVFSSPVPKAGETWKAEDPPALYAQAPGAPPKRLTFGTAAAIEPTVLRDGRILFVSARPTADSAAPPSLALFTINNDGTEVTAFALDRDGAAFARRPRELLDGRIGFLAAETEGHGGRPWAEAVRTARPFASRAKLLAFEANGCASVESAEEGSLLVSFANHPAGSVPTSGTFGIYRVETNATSLGKPIYDDSVWNEIEAVRVAARANPMGHISAMVPGKKTGTLLCLDVNFSRQASATGDTTAKARRVRVLTGNGQTPIRVLGEVPLREDGSFLTEVPADTPLGFESLDAEGRVLHRVPPSIWVRPGENRSCLGCHAPYNRSPRNLRPVAAFHPPIQFAETTPTVAQKTSQDESK